MKIIILIVTLSFLCPFTQAQKIIPNMPDYSVYSSDSIGSYYGSSGGNIALKFIVDSTGYLLKSIRVYSDNTLIQNIMANKDIENIDFGLEDYNFDGYQDISVVARWGTGGIAYWIWIYSPKDRKFHYDNDLSDQLGLIVDESSKQIIINDRPIMGEGGGTDIYKYRNNKLVLHYSEHHKKVKHNSTDWKITTIKEWAGKKWVTRIDSTKE
jgi:hypothetical protein